MAFVSQKDKRQAESISLFQEDYIAPAPFGETFAAGVGLAIDEELSISSTLNREGWANRKAHAEALIDAGEIDQGRYYRKTSRGFRWDWESLSQDRDDIKSNFELEEERKEMLARRREYAEDVFERGSGAARFLGSSVAFMLDPISVATMPIGFSTGAAKGLAAVGRAALKVGAVEMATETAIQAFVFEHKHDIESPYDWKDALANISTAAVAGGVLGGAGVGIREYIGSVRARIKDIPGDEKLDFADETLARMEETLSDNPLRKEGMSNKELVEADAAFMEGLEIRKTQAFKKEVPSIERVKIDGNPMLHGKEKSVLNKLGQEEDYAQDMLKYKQRFSSVEDITTRQVSKKIKQLDNLSLCDGGLASCIKKSGKSISRADAEAMLSRHDELIAKGLNETEADALVLREAKEALGGTTQKSIPEGVPIEINERVYDSNQFIKAVDDELDGIDSILGCLYR